MLGVAGEGRKALVKRGARPVLVDAQQPPPALRFGRVLLATAGGWLRAV